MVPPALAGPTQSASLKNFECRLVKEFHSLYWKLIANTHLVDNMYVCQHSDDTACFCFFRIFLKSEQLSVCIFSWDLQW